jgi:hypothetical protein
MIKVGEHYRGNESDDTVLSAGGPKTSVSTNKLLIHVHDVVMETPVDRVERLKISEGRTQPIGAQLNEKKTS